MLSLSHVLLLATFCRVALVCAQPQSGSSPATCASNEAGSLKCASSNQFYICGLPGQAVAVQNVAAGTECKDGSIVAISASSSVVDATHPTSKPVPGPAASTTSQSATSSSTSSSSPVVNPPKPKTFNCAAEIKGEAGEKAVAEHQVHCIDDRHWTLCGPGDTEIQELQSGCCWHDSFFNCDDSHSKQWLGT